jgi:DNA repair photolyase
MIIRDIDVLQEASRRVSVSVNFSIPTLDTEVWRRTEPGTPPPRQRLRALRALVDAGISAGVGMAPLLPGISDKPQMMRDVIKAARDAGAVSLWAHHLYLKPGAREHFLENLARDWPEQLETYQKLYAGPYVPRSFSEPVLERVRLLRSEYDIADRRLAPIEPPPTPEQLALFAAEA